MTTYSYEERPTYDNQPELHRYESGRYRLTTGSVAVCFSNVEQPTGSGHFHLMEDGTIVGYVIRANIRNDVMAALDDISQSPDPPIDPGETVGGDG